MRKSSKLSELFFREPQGVEMRQAEKAQWTSEGNQNRGDSQYVRRSGYFVNKPLREDAKSVKPGGTAGSFLSQHERVFGMGFYFCNHGKKG